MKSTMTPNYLLKNLQIVDGTGGPAYYGDISIHGDRIAGVGAHVGTNQDNIINCEGLTAAPGFIDIHNHSDLDIFDQPEARNYTSQGVTTLVTGNCGFSAAPVTAKNLAQFPESHRHLLGQRKKGISFSHYLEMLGKQKIAVNIAPLVGHGNVRGCIVGVESCQPSPEELENMRRSVREAMESGAFGMSTGLIYDPGVYAGTQEIIELMKVVKEYDGLYATHLRNESDLLVDSVMEAIRIGRESGARIQISHHKSFGKQNWGLVKTTLALMEHYRRHGIEITCDVYPCLFGNTDLYTLFPLWMREEGPDAFRKKIVDRETRNRLRHDLGKPGVGWENIFLGAGFDNIFISDSKKFKDFEGKSISAIASELNQDHFDAMFNIIEKDQLINVLVGGMCDEDMRYVIAHELSMIGSDGSTLKFGEGMPHPRNYRAFTKVLVTHAGDERLLSVERAVQKMSSMPACKLGLHDRGLLKPGLKADLAIFDPQSLGYDSDYKDPHRYSKGMRYVMVNGDFTLFDGAFTDTMAGRVLRKNGQTS